MRFDESTPLYNGVAKHPNHWISFWEIQQLSVIDRCVMVSVRDDMTTNMENGMANYVADIADVVPDVAVRTRCYVSGNSVSTGLSAQLGPG